LSPLASLTKLTTLYLDGDPLNKESIYTHVTNLEARGVAVDLVLWT
jgi:hypothetical protein